MELKINKIGKESILIGICLILAFFLALSGQESAETVFLEDFIYSFVFVYIIRWVIEAMVKVLGCAWSKVSQEGVESSGKINTEVLRKDRKNLVISMLLYSFLVGLSLITMDAFMIYAGFNLLMVIAAITFLGGVVSVAAGLGILRRLCYVLYRDNNPQKHFILFTVLIIAGLVVMSLPMIVVLFIVWFKVKKLLLDEADKCGY